MAVELTSSRFFFISIEISQIEMSDMINALFLSAFSIEDVALFDSLDGSSASHIIAQVSIKITIEHPILNLLGL